MVVRSQGMMGKCQQVPQERGRGATNPEREGWRFFCCSCTTCWVSLFPPSDTSLKLKTRGLHLESCVILVLKIKLTFQMVCLNAFLHRKMNARYYVQNPHPQKWQWLFRHCSLHFLQGKEDTCGVGLFSHCDSLWLWHPCHIHQNQLPKNARLRTGRGRNPLFHQTIPSMSLLHLCRSCWIVPIYTSIQVYRFLRRAHLFRRTEIFC